jgi:DNA-binding transcriptional LysR family regulator
MDRLNWSKLKTFYRVASCGSFVRAAEKYNITPSALSKMVKSLEQELNCQLFTRSENGFELTSKGQLLYRDAILISNILELTEEKILKDYSQVRNHLKLVAPIGLATIYIVRFIDDFVNAYPEVFLEVISYDDMSLNEKLAGHILINPFIKDLHGYKQEHLIDMELRLFASQEYLNKFGNPLTVEDLNNHRLIAFTQNKKLPVDLNWHLKLGMPKGQIRNPVFEADANFGRCYLAHKGVGIVTVPSMHPDIKKYNLVEVLPNIKEPLPKYAYYLIVDEILYEDEKIKALVKALKENFSAF